MNKLIVQGSMPMIEGGIEAMNTEPDLQLAEDAMPANIGLMEGLLRLDPENIELHTIAAQAYYGYGYGFTEDSDTARASRFYIRGLNHGLAALTHSGANKLRKIPFDKFSKQIENLDDDDVPAMFWTASNWAKWIDLNKDDPVAIAELARATALMEKVIKYDESFYYGSAHVYFGVYYGSRSPMFGGDFKKSKQHFDKARELTNNKLLIADLLQAQYLSRQEFNREDFHNRLTRIIEAPEDLYPELTLLNNIAKRKARILLKMESTWF